MKAMVLASTSVLALGTGAATAQVVTDYGYNFGPSPSTFSIPVGTYLLFGENDQQLIGSVSATLDNNSIVEIGPDDNANVVVNSNSALAIANGNIATTLAADDLDQDEDWGLRILSSQIVFTPATVVSSVTNVLLGQDIDGLEIGNLSVDDNEISATTAVNDATNILEGMPSDLDAPVAGTLTGGNGGGVLSMTLADVHSSIANNQFTVNAGPLSGSNASVADSEVSISNDATTMDGTVSLDGNRIAAIYGGNRAGNSILDPDSVDYAGSAMIGNAQVNTEDGGAGTASASISTSGMTITLALDTFTGTSSAGDNEILADSQGNAVLNRIVFGDGVNVSGANGTAGSSVSDDGATLAASLAADFAIGSAQGNLGSLLNSTIDSPAISTSLSGDLTGGILWVGDNAVQANAAGNQSDNMISADGPVVSASAAIGDYQTNDGTPVLAGIVESIIGASIAGDVVNVADEKGNVAIEGNTTGAAATGNDATSQISLSSVDLSVGSALEAAASADPTGFGIVSASGGAVITHLQSNYGEGEVSANVTASQIGTFIGGNVSDSVVAVDDNTFAANATGNDGSTGIQLSGTDGAGTAAIANMQISAVPVDATLSDNDIGIVLGDLSDGTLSLTSNAMNAIAIGNTGSNAINATGFTVLTLGVNDGDYHGTVGLNSVSSASLALASNQEFRDNVSAAIETDSEIIIAAGNVTDGIVAITGNAMLAAATGNQVGNALLIDAVNLAGANPAQTDLFGALVNMQSNMDGAGVTALVDGQEIGIGLAAASGSTISVSDNSAIAAADGSFAVNQLLVTGTTHAVATTGAAEPAEYSYILQSTQVAAGAGSITADVQNLAMGISGDSDDGSTLAISGNSQIAQARSNVAINAATFGLDPSSDDGGFANLQTSALLTNTQTSDAVVSATVTAGEIGLDITTTTGTNQAVTGNSMQALGVGNASENSTNVAAVNLQGNRTDEMPADFLVLNAQDNSGAISASVTGGQIGIGSTGAPQTITGGVASVLDNSSSARAIGNSSDNRLTLAAVSANVIGGVSNMQVNSASITASVTGMNIGIYTAGATSVNGTVNRNSIRASATGNSAVNVVRRTSY